MILLIARKELRILFASPLAWIVLAIIQLILAWVFLGRLNTFLEAQPELAKLANPPGVTEIIIAPVYAIASVMLLIVTPLLSMRLIAEERRNQTMPLLISAPISITAIVLGKFLGLMALFCIMIMLVTLLSLSLLAGSTPDLGLLASNIAGLFLISGCFAALGLYISCLTSHPVIAGTGTLGALVIFWIIDIAGSNDHVTRHLSLLKHYESFNRGIIDTFDLAFFILFILVFLILAIHRIDGERRYG